MAVSQKKSSYNNTKLKIIISIVILLVLLIILIVMMRKDKPINISEIGIEQADKQYKEQRDLQIRADLSDESEQERIQYYCANFFKLIDTNNYEDAYELLYDIYKENYFPNINNFKRYFKEYFPSDFGLSYNNIERLGDIYVLNVNVKDTVNGSYGKNFNMYVVVKENGLNDYSLSFSRNSAVGGEENYGY